MKKFLILLFDGFFPYQREVEFISEEEKKQLIQRWLCDDEESLFGFFIIEAENKEDAKAASHKSKDPMNVFGKRITKEMRNWCFKKVIRECIELRSGEIWSAKHAKNIVLLDENEFISNT